MTKTLFGKKLAMVQLFQTDGKLIPVTLFTVQPNIVCQIKTQNKDHYNAIQVVAWLNSKPAKRTLLNHLAKVKIKHQAQLREIITDQNHQLGDQITMDIFQPGDLVDVVGISKGKGTAGVIKRHNFGRGPMSHGSKHHRAPGSVGISRPDKIWKGQPLPGRKGNQQTTIRNLPIIACWKEQNILVIKGSVPGATQTLVRIRNAKRTKKTTPAKLHQAVKTPKVAPQSTK